VPPPPGSLKNVAVVVQGDGEARMRVAQAGQEYSHSLKGLADDPRGLERIGPDAEACVVFEPEGLRIALPARYSGQLGFHGERPDTGVVLPLGVKGDFDVAVTYEVLRQPEKEDAGHPQTRVSLDVAVDRRTNTAAVLSWRVSRWNGAELLAWMNEPDEAGGERKEKFKEFPAPPPTGRLRVVRNGSMLSYYAAEGADGEFKLLQRYPFSAADLEDVRVTGSTGGPRAALEVRLTDLRIRADAFILREPERRGWIGPLALALAALLAVAAAVVLGLRRSRPRGKVPPPARAAAPTLDFPCPRCGTKLVAGARCPRCDQAVQARPGG
jgi:hypothetical protein